MSKPIYKLVDSKGRVLIPKALRETAHMEYGDIVRIGLSSGNRHKGGHCGGWRSVIGSSGSLCACGS